MNELSEIVLVVLRRTVFFLLLLSMIRQDAFAAVKRGGCLRLLLCLLGQKDGLDVGEDTTLCDGDARQQLVQFFVVSDGQLQVTRDDTGLFVVSGGITGQFQNFGSQIFHHGCQVDRSAGTHAFGVVTLPEQTVNSAHRELEPGTVGSRLRLSLDFSAFTTTRHFRFGTAS